MDSMLESALVPSFPHMETELDFSPVTDTYVTPLQSDIFVRQQAKIRGLPPNLEIVPNDPAQWRVWKDAIMAYRQARRKACAADVAQQNVERELCRRDTAYFLCIWGVIFEPRSVENAPPSWKPFILFPFQVQMVRWIEHILTLNPDASNGRGDGVIEKSRDMGATNIFCGVFVKHFIFDDVFVAGFISKKFDDVDKPHTMGTIFYRLRALLGAEDAVPASLRLPRFLQPKGFDYDAHIATGAIVNPEPGKSCLLEGETTTKLSGVSNRSTARLNDEAARFDNFGGAWANQQATSDHRFALSSADTTHGPAFRNMAELGRECLMSPEKPGPSLLRLEYDLHPFHTPEWYQGQLARAQSNEDPNEFFREYNIDYDAERGAEVYPRFKSVSTEHVPYDPYGGRVLCLIDPGIRDPGAVVWLQQDLTRGGFNVVESFQGLGGEDVGFYASILTGTYFSGEHQYNYNEYPRIDDIMEFSANIGQVVTYIGDPAGNQRGAGGKDTSTWYKQLSMSARELCGATIFVNTITANNARSYETRKQAVNWLIPMLRFHQGQGGAWALTCMKNYRYKSPSLRGQEVFEPAKPMHDKHSHTATAIEYGAVWIKREFDAQLNRKRQGAEKRKPTRVSLSGNVVSGRQKTMFDRNVRTGRRDGTPW